MRVGIIGLGSVIMGDDGVGPYALRALEALWQMPDEVTPLDLGTPGPEFSHYLQGYDAAVVIDSVKTEGEPGEVRTYRRDEIIEKPPPLRMSPHDPSLRDAIMTTDFMGGGPREVLLIGVIPGRAELGTALTTAVKEAIPTVVTAIVAELDRLGVAAAKRDEPETPDLWWE